MSNSASPNLAQSWLELADGRMLWLQGRCTIGRQAGNDLLLDVSSVSRHHAVLAANDSAYVLTDLRSSNGSYVNRSPVSRPTTLRDGDELRFGDVTMRYRCTHNPLLDVNSVLPDSTRRLEDLRECACWLLLADVVGYSRLNAELGGKAALQRFQAWIAGMRPLLERNGAHINSYVGDAIFAWWPADAPEGKATVRRAIAALTAWQPQSPVEFRVVLHHGAVLFTRSERGEELSGQEVNFVFRSEKIAKGFGASTMLSQAAVHSLELDGQCPALGAANVEGISGRFVFFDVPRVT